MLLDQVGAIASLDHDARARQHLNEVAHGKDFASFVQQVEANRVKLGTRNGTDQYTDRNSTSDWPDKWLKHLGPRKKVGEGSFGEVFVAHVACDGNTKVAIKELAITSSSRSEVEQEGQLMDRFRGPSFVTLFESAQDSEKMYIMMEAADSDLEKLPGLTLSQKAQLFVDALKGVVAMHEQGYVHRDLKPANLLLANNHAKVADLGLTCSVHGGKMPVCSGIAGTPLYIAPETYSYEHGLVRFSEAVQEKNDVWAMGLILYKLLYGVLPRSLEYTRTLGDLAANIMHLDIERDARYWTMSSSLRKLMSAALERSTRYRADSAELLTLAEKFAKSVGCKTAKVPEAKLPPCWYTAGKAVNCKWNAWSSWGQCDAACDEWGYQERTRTIKKQGANGGVECHLKDARDSKRCKGHPCPRAKFSEGQYVLVGTRNALGMVESVLPYDASIRQFRYVVKYGCGARVSNDGRKLNLPMQQRNEDALSLYEFVYEKETCKDNCYWRPSIDPAKQQLSYDSHQECETQRGMLQLHNFGTPTSEPNLTHDDYHMEKCRQIASRDVRCGRFLSYTFNTGQCECVKKGDYCMIRDVEGKVNRIEYWYCNQMCPPDTTSELPDENGNCRCDEGNDHAAAWCYKEKEDGFLHAEKCPSFHVWTDKGFESTSIYSAECEGCHCCWIRHADWVPSGECNSWLGWEDSDRKTCGYYERHELCTSNGGYGRGWRSSWGTFKDNADRAGYSATDACCECGGGHVEKYLPARKRLSTCRKLDARNQTLVHKRRLRD